MRSLIIAVLLSFGVISLASAQGQKPAPTPCTELRRSQLGEFRYDVERMILRPGDIREVLEFGERVSSCKAYTQEAFDIAIRMSGMNTLQLLFLLVEKGADVNTESEISQSLPLESAINFGSSVAVRFLLAHGAKVTPKIELRAQYLARSVESMPSDKFPGYRIHLMETLVIEHLITNHKKMVGAPTRPTQDSVVTPPVIGPDPK